jgi:hypothetical protein
VSEPGSAARRRKPASRVSGLMRMVHLILRSPDRPASGYDAFISYSHLADDALAATLQAGLETFAGPWYRSRTLRVALSSGEIFWAGRDFDWEHTTALPPALAGAFTDWQMSVSTWLKVACASASHDLTKADWQEYVGGPPPAQLACAGA